jgi:putative intracellular protease/amidase/uncharacterized protein (DUF952 family)
MITRMCAPPRWLYHVVRARELSWGKDGRYAPSSLATEGFVHASFRDTVAPSAELYFAGEREEDLRVLALDPRRLDVPVEIVETPRGPMPHVHGSIPSDAVSVLALDAVADRDDRVSGTRIALLAFDGMTLLDLVGPLDALSRIASMGFDRTTTCEVVALTRPKDDETVRDVPVWAAAGLHVTAARYRPVLDEFDLVVVPGGPGARALARDPGVAAYLEAYPANRLAASVCTGALLLGAAGRLRGKRATTHARHLAELELFGAHAASERVVDEGQLVTAGGVTAGIELGLHLVLRLAGEEIARAIAEQMEARHAFAPG